MEAALERRCSTTEHGQCAKQIAASVQNICTYCTHKSIIFTNWYYVSVAMRCLPGTVQQQHHHLHPFIRPVSLND